MTASGTLPLPLPHRLHIPFTLCLMPASARNTREMFFLERSWNPRLAHSNSSNKVTEIEALQAAWNSARWRLVQASRAGQVGRQDRTKDAQFWSIQFFDHVAPDQ